MYTVGNDSKGETETSQPTVNDSVYMSNTHFGDVLFYNARHKKRVKVYLKYLRLFVYCLTTAQ